MSSSDLIIPARTNRIDLIRPDAPDLARPGPYPVGVQTLAFTNPDQIDVLTVTAEKTPLHDRSLKVEVWYPAASGTQPGGTYDTVLRDGRTAITLRGSAARDAAPAKGERFPLVVISHGYPGNRFLLSHLGENLASKGYVTAAVDHTDSTYSDQAAFGSTLYNRPLDQRFVIDQMAALPGPLGAITDAERTAVIGYSMGGYGVLVFGGAGLAPGAPDHERAPPNRLLARHLAGSDTHEALIDDRVKAVIAIGPWGANAGFWDETGLAGLRKPALLIAGEADDVSGYVAMRRIFTLATGTDRHLLTFRLAGHNAAAPIPAPKESWQPVDTLDFVPFEHYADAVWDSTRMNNIAQHVSTAFLDLHLKGDAAKAAFLDLPHPDAIPSAAESWPGFPPGTARGLVFESRPRGA